MRRIFGRGAAAAAVFALFIGGLAATPALAMESDSAPSSISDIDTLEIADPNELDQSVTLIEELVEVQGVESDVPVSDDLGTNDEHSQELEVTEDSSNPVAPELAEFDIIALEIAGIPAVGQTLTSVVEFSHTPDYVEFLWFADDDHIEGADGETLVLTEDLVGKTIVLGVYAANNEFDSGVEAYSNELGPVTAANPVTEEFDITTLKIVGTAKVGQTLTSVVEFSHALDYVEFQWFAGEDAIECQRT